VLSRDAVSIAQGRVVRVASLPTEKANSSGRVELMVQVPGEMFSYMCCQGTIKVLVESKKCPNRKTLSR